jgi:hypothetical protein
MPEIVPVVDQAADSYPKCGKDIAPVDTSFADPLTDLLRHPGRKPLTMLRPEHTKLVAEPVLPLKGANIGGAAPGRAG